MAANQLKRECCIAWLANIKDMGLNLGVTVKPSGTLPDHQEGDKGADILRMMGLLTNAN